MSLSSIDIAELGMAGGALVAILGASWKVFSVAVKFGQLLQKTEENEKAIALIPGLVLEIASIRSMVGQYVNITSSHAMRLDAYNSDIHQLKEDIAVNRAIREHSQGNYGQ